MRRLQFSKTFGVSLAIALVGICAVVIFAQSGRRVRKPETAIPVAPPEATPAPAPAPTPRPEPSVMFLVGMEKFGDFSRISLNTYSGVLRSCADRLDDSSLVKADTTSREMTRADAIRQAKAETGAYVVWLQIRSNNSYGQTSVYDDPDNLYIQYAVFAPTTAKQVTSGNTYPRAYQNARVRVPTSSTQGDYYMNQAARGAAERILDHFHLRLPSQIPRPKC